MWRWRGWSTSRRSTSSTCPTRSTTGPCKQATSRFCPGKGIRITCQTKLNAYFNRIHTLYVTLSPSILVGIGPLVYWRDSEFHSTDQNYPRTQRHFELEGHQQEQQRLFAHSREQQRTRRQRHRFVSCFISLDRILESLCSKRLL